MSTSLFSNKFTTALIIIIFIIAFHYLTILIPIEKVAAIILSPFQVKTFSLANNLARELSKIKNQEDLNQENQNLQQRIENLEKQVVDLKIFIEENKITEQNNVVLKALGFKFVNAKIIGHTETANGGLLILDEGTEKGVEKDMLVVANGGRAIGKIIKTESQKSFLLLLTDSQCKLSGTIAGNSEIMGVVSGEYNVGINLDYILKKAEIKIGDMIVTSGLDEHILPGVIIGEIKKIIDDPASLFKTANLTSAVNFNNLKNVSVIIY